MINVTEKLETPEHESILMVNKVLKKKGRIKKDIINNLVDVVSYCNNYCRLKGIECDITLAHEIITLNRKQIIIYGLNDENEPNIIKSE